MANSKKYEFEQFTLANYHRMILLAKENGYEFISFEDDFSKKKKCVLWRHDVEFSPFIALKMAEIEADEAIKATYFFQLHGELYNVLEKEISEIVLKIKSLGHEVGLHFDPHFFDIKDEMELEKFLELDAIYFNKIFCLDIKSFSFHNTTPFILSCNKEKYAGLINVYSDKIKEKFRYCADSTGYWRYEKLEDLLKDNQVERLQVLTHDAMWCAEILPPRQRVFKVIDENSVRTKRWYDCTLLRFGAKNIDWDEEY